MDVLTSFIVVTICSTYLEIGSTVVTSLHCNRKLTCCFTSVTSQYSWWGEFRNVAL